MLRVMAARCCTCFFLTSVVVGAMPIPFQFPCSPCPKLLLPYMIRKCTQLMCACMLCIHEVVVSMHAACEGFIRCVVLWKPLAIITWFVRLAGPLNSMNWNPPWVANASTSPSTTYRYSCTHTAVLIILLAHRDHEHEFQGHGCQQARTPLITSST